MLVKNTTLQYLNIGSNKISDDGVRYITEGLYCNGTLTELWLNNCNISVQGTCVKLYKTKHNYCVYIYTVGVIKT